MIHAYDKSYLSAAQKNLARMLDVNCLPGSSRGIVLCWWACPV